MTITEQQTTKQTLIGYLEKLAEDSPEVKRAIEDRATDKLMRRLERDGTFRSLLAEAMELLSGEFSSCNKSAKELHVLHSAFNELAARFRHYAQLTRDGVAVA